MAKEKKTEPKDKRIETPEVKKTDRPFHKWGWIVIISGVLVAFALTKFRSDEPQDPCGSPATKVNTPSPWSGAPNAPRPATIVKLNEKGDPINPPSSAINGRSLPIRWQSGGYTWNLSWDTFQFDPERKIQVAPAEMWVDGAKGHRGGQMIKLNDTYLKATIDMAAGTEYYGVELNPG